MKSSIHRGLLVAAAALTALTAPAVMQAQEPPKPSEQHKELKNEAGTWDAEVSMYMSPDAQPFKTKAIETNEMFGDYWLMSKFEGDFGGMKFKGHSMLGYDPTKKKFIGTWTDTMSPHLMTMEGEFDESTNTSTMYGTGTSLESGKPEKTKMVTVYENDDQKTFTMYMAKPGADDEWVKHMEIKYKRRK
jgi:hypothetical protein